MEVTETEYETAERTVTLYECDVPACTNRVPAGKVIAMNLYDGPNPSGDTLLGTVDMCHGCAKYDEYVSLLDVAHEIDDDLSRDVVGAGRSTGFGYSERAAMAALLTFVIMTIGAATGVVATMTANVMFVVVSAILVAVVLVEQWG